MTQRKRCQNGNAFIEFTLVGIPLVFTLISIFEMARGMWMYDTLAHAVREGTRYTIVHGRNCEVVPNTCEVATIQRVSQRIRNGAVGLVPGELALTFTSSSHAPISCTLDNCLNDTQQWPLFPDNSRGLNVRIDGSFRFSSAISMLWPAAGKGMVFGTFNLPASSRDAVQF